MEKLQFRSDGAAETSSGLFAVIMTITSGRDEETSFFEYKTTPLADAMRIEWPTPVENAPDVVLLPQDEARFLVRSGYARGLTKNQVEAYNLAVDADTSGEQQAAVIKEAPKFDASVLGASSPTVPETKTPAEGQGTQNAGESDNASSDPQNASDAPNSAEIPPVDGNATAGDNKPSSDTPVVPVVPKKGR